MDPGNLKNHDFRRFKQLPFLKIKARSSFWRARRGLFFSKSLDLVLACPQGPFFSQKARIWLPQGSSFKIDGGLFKIKPCVPKVMEGCSNQISEGGRELSSTAYSSKICVFGIRRGSHGSHRSRGSGGRIRGSDPPSHTRRGPG